MATPTQPSGVTARIELERLISRMAASADGTDLDHVDALAGLTKELAAFIAANAAHTTAMLNRYVQRNGGTGAEDIRAAA
ncbi:hypothetical protein [Streptomyces sp. NPDC005077]|uniref:hypothetical protein n=1 Tax=Streptomyces sp. NPDC005077 TaxID=3154292 RepID=UPI0033B18816